MVSNIVKEIIHPDPVQLERNLSVYNITNGTDYSLDDLNIFNHYGHIYYRYFPITHATIDEIDRQCDGVVKLTLDTINVLKYTHDINNDDILYLIDEYSTNNIQIKIIKSNKVAWFHENFPTIPKITSYGEVKMRRDVLRSLGHDILFTGYL